MRETSLPRFGGAFSSRVAGHPVVGDAIYCPDFMGWVSELRQHRSRGYLSMAAAGSARTILHTSDSCSSAPHTLGHRTIAVAVILVRTALGWSAIPGIGARAECQKREGQGNRQSSCHAFDPASSRGGKRRPGRVAPLYTKQIRNIGASQDWSRACAR